MSTTTPEQPLAISYGGDLPFEPDFPATMPEALVRAAQRFPDAGIHVVSRTGERRFVSNAELLTRASAVLGGLRERGVAPGDHAVLRVSDEEYFPVFWGCVLGGVVPVTVGAPPSYHADSTAREALIHTWRTLGEPVVLAGPADVDGLRSLPMAERVVPVAELAAAAPVDVPQLAATPETVAMLQLSSGSTGTPKIIQLTHRGIAEYAIGAREMIGIRPADILLNWLPLDHIAGLLLYHLGGTYLGASTVQVDTSLVLADPLRWLDLMQDYRVTHSWAPNFGLRMVADAVGRAPGRRWDLCQLRRMVSGGEQCLPETFQAFLDATSPSGVAADALTMAWGMSETATAICFASYAEPGALRRVRVDSLGGHLEWAADGAECVEFLTVGPPAPGATFRIVDAANHVLPERRIGRLQVRSTRNTPGYLSDPETTRAAYPEPGWLDTGDLAYMVDGWITITGREKDMIVLNGQNYPCHEFERIAGRVAGVNRDLVGACGVPDPATGTEQLVVFYAPDPDADVDRTATERAITAAIGQRLHVAVARVVAVPAADFPRTSGGKIQRARLRQRYLDGGYQPAPPSAPAASRPRVGSTAVRRVVLDAAAEIAGEPVDPSRPFYELGMGSVQIVQLRAKLEAALGRDIPQPALFAHPSVDALTAFLADAAPAVPAGPAASDPADGRIAVIGMAGRLPGAATVDEYWANLTAGVQSLRVFTPEELAAAGVPAATIQDPDFVPVSGALDDITSFDAGYFGISAREAELLDPQHRLFLEICQHALEDAGYAGRGDDGAAGRLRIGLFAGSGMNLYTHHTYLRNNLAEASGSADPVVAMGSAMGNQPDFLATRVAYRLNLTGPAIGVQTACSTSLVAVHLAVRSLLAGDADIALAGASAVHVPQATGYRHTDGSILSRRGRCRPFDADADGTVGGNGVAAVVLKPLERALADGDTIHAVILGSAVNNDGASKVGFTAPGVAGQVEVVRRALRAAAVPAESIGYVEAHGTGTALGDPVEYQALAEAYPTGTRYLGSVKGNIGHLDSCAGMAGLLKAVLAVRTGLVPPQCSFDRPHPAIDLAGGPFRITTTLTAWPATHAPRRAGVSALGVGGTNAHVIVEEPPAPAVAAPSRTPAPGLLPISAADPAALRELARHYRDRLAGQPAMRTADLVVTAALGRSHLRHRLVALGDTTDELAKALDAYLADPSAGRVLTGEIPVSGAGPLAFAFPGQGAAPQAVLDLAGRFAPVHDVLARAAEVYRDVADADLLDRLRAGPTALPTDVSQPALVALGIGLAALWRSWGVEPAYVLGHSVGEYAALAAAGALSPADAIRLVAHRGRLMQEHLPPGAMLAVFADRATVDEILDAAPGVALAAVNGTEHHVLAGPPDVVDEAMRQADVLGVPARRLAVSRAFHTAGVAPVLDRFRAVACEVAVRPIEVPFVSTLDGELRTPGWIPDVDYLCRQARQPVQFAAAVRRLADAGCRLAVEAGPDAVLTGMTTAVSCIPSQPRNHRPVAGLWRAVAGLHCAGVDLDWSTIVDGCGGRRVPLPRYPFQRRRHWIDAPTAAAVTSPTAQSDPTRSDPTRSDPVQSDPAPSDSMRTDPAGPDPVTPAPVVVMPAASASGDPDPAGPDEILARIRTMTADRLGVDAADIAPDDSFFGLGADSFLLVTMSREVDRAFGVRIPVRELFGEVNSPRRLAEAIAAAGSPASPAPAGTAPAPAGIRPLPPAGIRPLPPAPLSTTAEPVGPPGTAPAAGAPPAGGGSAGTLPDPRTSAAPIVGDIVRQQLDVMRQQLALLAGGTVSAATAPAPAVAATAPAAVTAAASPVNGHTGPGRPAARAVAPAGSSAAADTEVTTDFSLYFFGDYPASTSGDAYQVILDAAEFADQNGFHALWVPERHFHSFGGIFPNPSVLTAALAARTRRIRLNAGSVVLPLHHPIRVAEEWSMIDNLSNGRVGLGCAPGWHSNDFVFFPDHYGKHKQVMYEHLDTVRRLWRGEAVPARSGSGEQIEVRLFPRPVQPMPPVFTAIVGNPDSYREAARRDIGVVTNLMTQDIAQLADNIALYRRTRAEHGLDPGGGRVVVLLHTYLGADLATVRERAFDPFCAYLRSSLSLLGQVTNSLGLNIDLDNTPEDDVRFLLGQAYQRYCEQRALIGTPDSCREVVHAVLDAGVDEIACFVDFGLPADAVRDGLPYVDVLRRGTPRRTRAAAPAASTAATDMASPATGPAPAEGVELAPLSAAQRRLWLVEQMYPDRPAYNEAAAVRLLGPLDTTALQEALRDVVARHAPLRTTFRAIDGEPMQVVHEQIAVRCPVVDRTGRDEDDTVRQVLAEESRRLFDLATGPLFAWQLLRFSATHHVLVATFHHIVTDGRSYAVFTRDVSACYQARVDGRAPALPALPVTYPQLARAHRDDPARREGDLRYWREQLRAPVPTLVLPSDLPRPAVPSAAGRSLFEAVPAEVVARVRAFSRSAGVTVFTTLLSAFAITLARASGQTDFVVGTGATNRDEDGDDLIGFFVDTVPLRFDLSGDPTFAEFAARVQRTAADSYAHAMPFDALVEGVAPQREAGRHPLFDVAIEYETGAAFAFDLPQVTATPLRAGLDKAPVDLMVYVSHHKDIDCHLEFRTEVFDEATVRRLFAYFRRVLDRATGASTMPLSRLADELDQPGCVRSGPVTPPADELLPDLFVRRAARTPDAIAVAAGELRWTYRQLHERADGLARRLAGAGVAPGDLVGVLLPRQPDVIAAQLGVLLAGAAFVPLDPAYPAARLAALLGDSGARLVVTSAAVAADTAAVAADAGVPRLVVEDEPERTATPAGPVTPDHPAWCVYTSGSTGRPKGVLVSHRAAINAIRWHVRALGLSPADVVAHTLALGFDANLSEIYPALAAGATLQLAPEQVRVEPAAMVRWWGQQGVTTAFLPAPLAELVFALPTQPDSGLRNLVVGGSALRRRPPSAFTARVLNAYGPTENAIVTTAGPVAPAGAGGVIDIGVPVDNVRLYVLDPAGAPVPAGAVGELYLAGRSLAVGYLGRPKETAAAFLPDPFGDDAGARMYRTGDRVRLRGDGTVEFLGRVDDQVKIAGHRVEPAEAGAALARMPGVRQAVVVARDDRTDEPHLVGYVVPESEVDNPAQRQAQLAAALSRDLPPYLIPRAWVFLPELPVGDTGKVDLAALPAPSLDVGGDEPATALERLVHDAWCAELGVPRLPLDGTFFAAGGHSLGALRLANRLGELLDVEVPVYQILQAAGIRALAATLAGDRDVTDAAGPAGSADPADPTDLATVVAAGDRAGVADHTGEDEVEDEAPAAYQQEQMWRRQREVPNPAILHMTLQIELTGQLSLPALTEAFNTLVRRHPALRTRLVERDGEFVQQVIAHRPITIDVSDVAADDVDAWATSIGHVPFADGETPLLRVAIARTAADRHMLLLIINHVAGDGWSIHLLVKELEEAYPAALAGRRPALAPVGAKYVDYARQQRDSLVSDRVLAYWVEQLRGASRKLQLPTDRPGPASWRGGFHEYRIPSVISDRLAGVARMAKTTMFPVLASAYAALMSRLTGSDDILLNSPYAGRAGRTYEGVVGLFATAVITRLRPSAGQTFADLVAAADATFIEAVRHQPAPFPLVCRHLDPNWRPGLPPPIGFLPFAWDPGQPELNLPGLAARVVDQPLGIARQPFATILRPAPKGVLGVALYATDVLNSSTAVRWCEQFVQLLDAVSRDPHRPIESY